MATMTAFDPKKGHKRIKDFVSGRVTLVQGGRKYTERGFPVIDTEEARSKYLCPKCDFRTGSGKNLVTHAVNVHGATEPMLVMFETYIENMDRGLPADEGIDWRTMTVKRTSAQLAYDRQVEREKSGATAPAVEPEKEPEAQAAAKPESWTCPSCPDREPFKTQNALIAHARIHKAKKKE